MFTEIVFAVCMFIVLPPWWFRITLSSEVMTIVPGSCLLQMMLTTLALVLILSISELV